MKVVINACYGGFSLSALAVKRLAELNGKDCYFFESMGLVEKYKPIYLEEITSSLFFTAFSVPNPNEYLSAKKWSSMTDSERQDHNKKYDEIALTSRPEDREDSNLIQVVEELGESANGSCARLKIIQIPDGIQYVIQEYDGIEHVAEKHETWS